MGEPSVSVSKRPKTFDDLELFENNDQGNDEEIETERELINEMKRQTNNCVDANLLELRGSLGLEGANCNEKEQLCGKCLEFTTAYQQEKVKLRYLEKSLGYY